jgi:hypothetical protein
VLADLPDPERAFVGGGDIVVLDAVLERLRPGGVGRRLGAGRQQRHPPLLPRQRRQSPGGRRRAGSATTAVPARGLPVTPVTADHVTVAGGSLPSPGTWTIAVTAVRAGTPLDFTFEVPIT